MTWSTERCAAHPNAEIVRCCQDCIDVMCSACGRQPDAIVTFADDDDEGLHPLTIAT